MHMSGESLMIILVVGLIAGWLAGQIVQGAGFGIVGDLLIGIAGAFIGSWLLSATRPSPRLGHYLGNHQRHHRGLVTVAGHQAHSWRRPLP
jgi:uncharacterized membrane protein YeaQ/YmgE (transglycosylase-associated protein family)